MPALSAPADWPPLLLEGRTVQTAQTGVGSYARALVRAARIVHPAPEILCDRLGFAAPQRCGSGRISRHWRALTQRSVQARRGAQAPAAMPKSFSGCGLITGDDIFRRAQVHFGYYGTPLQVSIPGAPGLAHWCHPVPIAIAGWTNVYTVHDLIPIDTPRLTPMGARRVARLLRALAARAALFITVSQYSAARLEQFLGRQVPIRDCGIGLDLDGAPSVLVGQNRSGEAPFLFIGTIERRKNLVRLIEAYRRSRSRRPLHLVGPRGEGHGEILALAHTTPGVVWTDYVERGELLARLAAAHALLFPSLSEGFGLPALEAMALGTPVLASATGALGEVTRGGALQVDPRDTAAMAQAIARLDRGGDLHHDLVSRGHRLSQDYTIERFAERLAGAYRLALGREACR
jgi:glycosyltransferase involved in cell wall biosynthesis